MSSLLYDSIFKNKTDKAYLEFKLHVIDLENKFDQKMRQSDRLKFRQKYGLEEVSLLHELLFIITSSIHTCLRSLIDFYRVTSTFYIMYSSLQVN